MNKELTPEERAVLEYIRAKTQYNKFHQFYPNDIVVDNKTINDHNAILINMERKEYITSRWRTDMSTEDPNKQNYFHIVIKPDGFKALLGDDVYMRLNTIYDSKTQIPIQ